MHQFRGQQSQIITHTLRFFLVRELGVIERFKCLKELKFMLDDIPEIKSLFGK